MQLELGMKPDFSRWSEQERSVYDIISRHLGRDHGVLLSDIGYALNVDTRTIRAVVKSLVENRNVAICSGCTGFFIPVEEEEIIRHQRDLLSRAYSILARANKLNRGPALSRLRGQAHLELQKLDRKIEAFSGELNA